MAKRRPHGWGQFDKLARKVAAVPKEAVDEKIASEKKARKRRKRKNK